MALTSSSLKKKAETIELFKLLFRTTPFEMHRSAILVQI